MSWQAHKAVIRFSQAKGATRCILHALAEHAHEDGGGAFPSFDTIEREANVARGTIRPALTKLEAWGEITRTGTRRSGTAEWRVALVDLLNDKAGDQETEDELDPAFNAKAYLEREAVQSSNYAEAHVNLEPGPGSAITEASSAIGEGSSAIDGESSSGIEPEPSVEPSRKSSVEKSPSGSRIELGEGQSNGNTRREEEPHDRREVLELALSSKFPKHRARARRELADLDAAVVTP